MIDNYCERTDPSFWSEPANALTNIAFVLASILAWRLLSARGQRQPYLIYMALLMAVVGTGSFLFHTLATPWSAAADMLPIYLFQLSFLWLYAIKVLRFSPAAALGLLAVFGLSAAMARNLPVDLNGSQTYLAALLFVVGFAIIHWRRAYPGRRLLIYASAGLTLGLIFRTVDLWVCPWFPLGTHLFWHCLTAVVLYLSFRVLADNAMAVSESA